MKSMSSGTITWAVYAFRPKSVHPNQTESLKDLVGNLEFGEEESFLALSSLVNANRIFIT